MKHFQGRDYKCSANLFSKNYQVQRKFDRLRGELRRASRRNRIPRGAERGRAEKRSLRAFRRKSREGRGRLLRFSFGVLLLRGGVEGMLMGMVVGGATNQVGVVSQSAGREEEERRLRR